MSDWIWLLIGLVGGTFGSVFFYRLGYKIGWRDAEDDFADRASMERRRTSGSTWYEPH
jgi:membrane protein YqaA with SNARE-associated domain